jgi:prepilin signal peptidase PulO-like enzyme (type II secretory pathway)
VLIWLIVVASMIDIDEKTIPDVITVPGVLVGLLAAALLPRSLLPDLVPVILLPRGVVPQSIWELGLHRSWPLLQVASPNAWPAALGGYPLPWPLVAGLGCWWAWCAALLPRSWYSRHGWRRALRLCVARVVRDRSTYGILAMGLVGSAGIAAVWAVGGEHWKGLLSAVIGMAAAGGLVWAVRVIATACLNREAMGFGDVTLMAMIGAFLGWQTCLVVFFLAPLAALGVGVLRLVLHHETEIPYGPFLGLAAVVAVVWWAAIWGRLWVYFEVPWLVPAAVGGCLVLMPLILGVIQLGKRALR